MQTNQLALKIGIRVKAIRIQRGLTQEQLAEKIGVSWSAISNLERGRHIVSIERLLDISAALDVGLEVILCDYINLQHLENDPEQQELIKQISLLTINQKKYLLDNLKLITNYFPY